MPNDLDFLLKELKSAPLDHDLSGLEIAVRRRLKNRRAEPSVGSVRIQMAVVCGALILGLAVAQISRLSIMPAPLSSEMVVLSDDSLLAPSVRLEGGS